MDGVAEGDDEELSSVGHTQELSQSISSGVLSLPSANKLADISIASDISDSEIEIDTVLDVATSSKLTSDSSFLKKTDISATEPVSTRSRTTMENFVTTNGSFKSSSVRKVIPVSRGTEPLYTDNDYSSSLHSSQSLGEVKFALQENCNLLSDQHLLNDLLRSIDEKIAQEASDRTRCNRSQPQPSLMSYIAPNRDPGPGSTVHPGFSNPQENNTSQTLTEKTDNLGLTSSNDSYRRPKSQTKSVGTFLANSSDPNMLGPAEADSRLATNTLCHQLTFATTNQNMVEEAKMEDSNSDRKDRHVKFQQPRASSVTSDSSSAEDAKTIEREPPAISRKSSSDLSLAETVIRQLSGLRWKLAGWEDAGALPPSDYKSALEFVHHLLNNIQVLQLQKKHLQDELRTAKSQLSKLSEEATVQHGLREKQAVLLSKASNDLAGLQREWIDAHDAAQADIQRLKTQGSNLEKERTSLREESALLRKNVTQLNQALEDHHHLKMTLEEVKTHLASSRKQAADVVEENSRLNQLLQEKQRLLMELEEVKLPHYSAELSTAVNSLNKIKDEHEKLIRSKAHQDDDLRILRDQHQTLLKKVIDEEELKEAALREKAGLEKKLSELSSKTEAVKNDLHSHYQAQVQELVSQKSQDLQDQLRELEADLKKNLEDQLNAQRESHHHTLANNQQKYEKEFAELNASHAKKISRLEAQLAKVTSDNWQMVSQRQHLIAAVSSILGPQQNLQMLSDHALAAVDVVSASSLHGQTLSSSDKVLNGNDLGNDPSTLTREILQKNFYSLPKEAIHTSESHACSNKVLENLEDGNAGAKLVVRRRPGSADLSKPSLAESHGKDACSSRNSSRPTSGKSSRGVPHLRHLGSSSDSDSSIFSDRHETVRQASGKATASPQIESLCLENIQANTPRSGRDLMKSSSSQKEVKSLPELNINMAGRDLSDNHYHLESQRVQNRIKGRRKYHRGQISENVIDPSFKKIYRASEILRGGDTTVDEDTEDASVLKIPSVLQIDQAMERLLQELKTLKANSNLDAGGCEVPTHDTSLEQEPASITLHKLKQVSNVLSQYVRHSPPTD